MKKVFALSAVTFSLMLAGAAQAAIEFRAASTSPEGNWKMMASADGRYYVAPTAAFTFDDVTSTTVMDGGRALAIRADGITGSAGRMAVIVDGELVTAPKARMSGDDVVLTDLSRTTGMHLLNVLGKTGADAGAPVLVAEAVNGQVKPGETFKVDVFIENPATVNLYQVRVHATSSADGRLPVVSQAIDKSRSDYLFGDANVIDAVDDVDKRVGGLMLGGQQITASGRRYLGTYEFRAPAQAGLVYVNIEVGEESFLRTATADAVSFNVGTPAVVRVGDRSSLRGGN